MTSENNKLTATEQALREAALKAASQAIGKAADKADPLDTGVALAAIAAAKTATPAADKPVEAKPTGATPTVDKPTGDAGKPAIKPVTAQGGSSGGKGKGKAKPTATATAKPKADDKADNSVVEGFDLSRWPAYLNSVKPERWALVATAAPLVGNKPVYKPGTSNHLALACYLQMGFEPSFNYFDVGEGIALVRNTQPDNKSNCANRWQSLGLGFIQKRSPVAYKNPDKTGSSGGKMAYGMTLYETDNSGKVTRSVKPDVVKKIQAYLEANNCKAPARLFGPLVKPATDKPALPSK